MKTDIAIVSHLHTDKLLAARDRQDLTSASVVLGAGIWRECPNVALRPPGSPNRDRASSGCLAGHCTEQAC